MNLHPRARRWLVVLPIVALLTGALTYLSITQKSPCAGCRVSAGPMLPTVASNVAPPSWIPVPYGNIQISVPPTWVIGVLDCPGLSRGDGWVSLWGVTDSNPPTACPGQTHLSPNQVVFGPTTVVPGTAQEVTVNGFDAYQVAASGPVGGLTYVIPFPSLQMTLTVEGPLAERVVHTVTNSPRAVVTAGGSAPPVPTTWHHVSFMDLVVAVPKRWPVQHQARAACLPIDLPGASSVDLQTGPNVVQACALPSDLDVERATDGIVIAPGPTNPTARDAAFASCIDINHLSVCPTISDNYGIFVASVHVPGHVRPVTIKIGLAGNGVTARTILDSLRAK